MSPSRSSRSTLTTSVSGSAERCVARPAMKLPPTFRTGDPSYFVAASTAGSASPSVLTISNAPAGADLVGCLFTSGNAGLDDHRDLLEARDPASSARDFLQGPENQPVGTRGSVLGCLYRKVQRLLQVAVLCRSLECLLWWHRYSLSPPTLERARDVKAEARSHLRAGDRTRPADSLARARACLSASPRTDSVPRGG